MKTKRFDYTWVIIAMSFLMVMISLGFTSSTKSLFPDEIAKDLGVARSLVAIGESCRYITTAVVTIFFGSLVAKFGPKKLICFGYVFLIISMLLYSFANNLIVIYIAGTCLGVGLSFTATSMVGYIVGMWCSKNKGTIMGAVLAANGIGGAIAISVAGNIIDPEVVGSYRTAYRVIATVLLVTLVILAIFLRDKKKDGSEFAKPAKKSPKRGQDWVGIEFSDAIRKFYFWGALICIFFAGVILQGTHGIVKMHLTGVGINYDRVIPLLSLGSLFVSIAKFLTGFIYDRFGIRITSSWCMTIAIVSSFMLALVKGNDTGLVLAIIYVVISQFALPLETIMLPIYAADLFGKKSYPKILGIFVSVNTAGYAVGSPMMNLCYDIFGTYSYALIAVGIIMVVTLTLVQIVISKAHKERVKIEAEIAAQSELVEA